MLKLLCKSVLARKREGERERERENSGDRRKCTKKDRCFCLQFNVSNEMINLCRKVVII